MPNELKGMPQTDIISSLPLAGGGIARAAYAAALKANVQPDSLLTNAGLTADQLKDSAARIGAQNQIKFLNLVAGALQDQFLGIRLAQSIQLRELGLLYYVMASSETLGDALTRVARYCTIQNEGVRLIFQRHKHVSLALEYAGVPRGADRHQIECITVLLLRLSQEFTGRRLSPDIVQFTHYRNSVPADIKSVFSCPINFGAHADEIIFPLSTASIPIVNADAYLNTLLMKYCEEALTSKRAKQDSWRSRIENAITLLLPHREVSLETIAQRLGVSKRTLARRLAEENVSFLEVFNELRLDLARQYLRDDGLSVAEVAWLLGYQEISAFSHAIKRWTGQSASQLRSGTRGS
jgi:AraC-like DNA-binding protein